MAQVASWKAPMGDHFGSKNDCQEPHNTDNYNEQLRFNKTVGYFKPPFCSWPRGGYSKKETKSRIKTGEPVVKAGSFEIDGEYELFVILSLAVRSFCFCVRCSVKLSVSLARVV